MCLSPIGGTHANRRFCNTRCKDRARKLAVYGLTPQEYRKLIADTGGKCPICKRNVKRWNVDHNHRTGETTGAVCTMCNVQLLAHTGHDIAIAERLVIYLKDPPVPRLFGVRKYTGPEMVPQIDRMWMWSQKKKTR